MEKNCISCKKKIVNDPGSATFKCATFKCPQCAKYELTRCTNCRSKAAKYACPGCGFTGPN
ncbi:hypothetical protein HZC30_05965 [Candidatus Woesearchaeota archaeon]|nr:hypothetical protein [Candidatus Woesearchaeota archaeon]